MENFKELSLAELMDKSVRLHIKNFVSNAAYILIYSIINTLIVFGVALIFILPITMGSVMGSGVMYGDPLGGLSVFILPFMIIITILYSFEFAKHIGFISVVKDDIYGRKVNLNRMLKSAYKNIFRVMSVVIAGGIMLSPIIIGFLVYVFNVESYSYDTQTWLVMTLFIVIGILFAVFFTYHIYAVNAAFVEDLYFFDALKRSRELVKGKVLKTFGKITLMSIVSSAIVSSLLSIIGVITLIIVFGLKAGGASQETEAIVTGFINVLNWPIQMVTSFFVGPLFAFFISLNYYNERFIREGLDVELTCERLTAKMKFDKERESNV